MEEGEERRARTAAGRAVLACALLAAVTAIPLVAGPGRQADLRVEGEYSLSVLREDGRLVVRWLTGERARGVFEARAAGRSVHRDTTPEGAAHEVRFPAPDADRVLLRYGAVGASVLHETAVRLDGPGAGRDRKSVFRAPDSLWVVGDVHGHYDRLRALLENAGLVDGEGRWAGGRSHLTLLGDLMDRGPYVTRTLWFVYRLQEEARAEGGRVHALLGNHEVMVLTGDHRYVPGRERLLAHRLGVEYGEMYHSRRSVLGRWLTAWPAAIRVGRVLLAHGGIGPAYLDRGAGELNDSLAAFVSEDLFEYWADSTVEVAPRDSAAVARRIRFLFRGPSPLWYRGYARTDTAGSALRALLAGRDARMHVIAHTPVPTIREAYGDSVVLVDLERPASEMLLLVPDGEGYERWVYPVDGPPRRLGKGAVRQVPGPPAASRAGANSPVAGSRASTSPRPIR